MGEYALYKALQSFTPPAGDSTLLEFQKDDVLEISVESPFTTSKFQKPGLLYAYNRRTQNEGYVPVEFVKLLGSKVNNTIHHPSALGVEVGDVNYSKLDHGNIHKTREVFLVNPAFCKLCEDYIWGSGPVAVKCLGKFYIFVLILFAFFNKERDAAEDDSH